MIKDMEKVIENISKVVIGKESVVIDILKAILAEGHILIEDVPGVGKTMLIKALSKSIDLSFNRIQFTPDILPSDILGVSIYNQQAHEFNFKKGPIFANMILADEINRTSPKTQSALIEVMEEKQVSDGNNTYLLDLPFMVMATENPLEYSGTFSLPEAVLDRFLIKLSLGYPSKDEEIKMLSTYKTKNPLDSIFPVITLEELKLHQNNVKKVNVSHKILEFIVDIVNKTRNCDELLLGASPRTSIALLKISQATAYINNRNYVTPDDIKENIKKVLSHRIIISKEHRFNGTNTSDIIDSIIKKVSVPDIKYA